MPPAFEGNRLESAVGSLVKVFAMLSNMISDKVSLVLESGDFK